MKTIVIPQRNKTPNTRRQTQTPEANHSQVRKAEQRGADTQTGKSR